MPHYTDWICRLSQIDNNWIISVHYEDKQYTTITLDATDISPKQIIKTKMSLLDYGSQLNDSEKKDFYLNVEIELDNGLIYIKYNDKMVDIQQDQLNTFYDNSTLYIITKNKDIWNEFQEMKLEWMKKGLNSDEYSLEVDNVETDMLDFYNLLLLNNYQSEKVYFSYDPDFFYLNGVEIDDTVYTIKMIIHKVEAEAEAPTEEQ